MPSKKSSFKGTAVNVTLLKKNLHRFWPLWGGVSLIGSVLPLYLLLSLLSLHNNGFQATAKDVAETLYITFINVVPVITLFYAVLCAMAVWSYLYSARSVGMFHALPVDRGCLFLTSALSGLAMMLLPYVIVGALTALICLAFGILPLVAVLQVAAGVLGLTIFFFATATLCAHLTSHIFALPVFYFIGHFFAVVLHFLLSNFASSFIFGYVGGSSPPAWVEFLSPTVFLFDTLGVEYIRPEDLEEAGTYALEGMWAVGVYTLIGFALLGLAYLLYRLRQSESAGEVVAFAALRPVFRYGVALASALTLGQVLYEILYRIPFQEGAYADIIPMGVCMAAAAIVGYYVASMLLKKSARVFRDWQGPLTTAAIIVVLCCCVSFDVFGIAAAVPAAGDIDTLHVSCNYSTVGLTLERDDPLLPDALALHRTVIENESAIRSDGAARGYTYPVGEEMERCGLTLFFDYQLEGGGRLRREYYIFMTRHDWETAGTYANALNAFLNDPDTQEALYTVPDGATVTMGYFDFYNMAVSDPGPGDAPYTGEDYYGELDQAQTQLVYEAVLQDAREGNIGETEFFDHGDILGYIDISYNLRRQDTDRPGEVYDRSYTLSLDVYDTMEHTLAALEAAGVLPLDTGGEAWTPLPEPGEYEVVPLPATEAA